MFRSKVRMVHTGIISVFRRSWASKQAFSLTSVGYPPDLDMARQSQQTFDLSLQRSSPLISTSPAMAGHQQSASLARCKRTWHDIKAVNTEEHDHTHTYTPRYADHACMTWPASHKQKTFPFMELLL